MREEIGKFFVDIAKLVFGGVVLSTILHIEGDHKIAILLFGFSATFIFAIIGFVLLKINKK